jgi:hypothetical protein
MIVAGIRRKHLLKGTEKPLEVTTAVAQTRTDALIEKQVHVRPVHDMTDEMAQELINLPRFTAYAKIIEEKGGEQRVWKGKIQTRPLYKETHNSNRVAIDNASVWSLKREAVEAEIRQRQEKWRQPTTQASPPEPPEEPPPPTSF